MALDVTEVVGLDVTEVVGVDVTVVVAVVAWCPHAGISVVAVALFFKPVAAQRVSSRISE